jgi:YidC/Oxa1 family membrane protein insertase
MNDQRNLFLALALSLCVLFAWQTFVAGPQQKQRQQQAAAIQATQPSQTQPEAPRVLAAGQVASEAGAFARESALAKGRRIQIESATVDGSISLDEGGRFDDLRLKAYRETVDPKSPEIVLLSPGGTANPYYAYFDWKVPGADSPASAGVAWQAEDPAPLTPEHPVTLRREDGQGLIFIRKIELDDRYMFTITDRVENTGQAAVTRAPFGRVRCWQTEIAKLPKELSRDARCNGDPKATTYSISHEGPIGAFDHVVEAPTYKRIAKDGKADYQDTTPGGWLGITDKYWMAALIPDQSVILSARFLGPGADGGGAFRADFEGAALSIPPGGAVSVTHHFFAGPKEVNLIDHYADDLHIVAFDHAVDWGWFYYLTRPIFRLLDFYYGLVGNFGLAILLLTVTIKAALFPLANRSFAAMSKMKKLQPEMTRLRDRFKDDKAKQQQAIMELYKKEKVNPLAGCLPIFIQIPVFFSLYKVLFITIEMRHSPFIGWIRDLSAPEPTTIFNLFGLIPWEPPGFLHIFGILPIIMGLTMFLQTKMNPAPADPVQQKVFLFMPVIFTYLMGSFPAGLVVYWTWNNTLSIAQQYVIMKRMNVDLEWETKFPTLFFIGRTLRRRVDKLFAGDSTPQEPGE